MESRKSIDAQAGGIMVVLCMIWGLQQVSLKATAADIAPMLQIGIRSGVAAVLVAAIMLWRGERFSLKAWRPGMLVGVLFALEFVLIAEALRHTTASRTVVFLYTAPIFAALGLHLKLPAERLTAVQWLGIALAFTGVAAAFLGGSTQGTSDANGSRIWGDFLALLSGIAWGATTVTVRISGLSQAPATQTLLYQLVAAFVLLVAATLGVGQAHINLTPLVWTSLVFQSVIVSFASYLTWFWLLRNYLASRLGVFSFLTPVFGVAFGAVLLDEPLESRFLAGSLLVMLGIVVVGSHAWLGASWRKLFGSAATTGGEVDGR